MNILGILYSSNPDPDHPTLYRQDWVDVGGWFSGVRSMSVTLDKYHGTDQSALLHIIVAPASVV